MISIIIPLYNKENIIRNSICSVLTQDYNDYEIIIIDDGSTDKSVDVVESLQSEKIFLYRKQNGGPSSARNYGVKKAQGEWLLFLDADDELLPGALVLADRNIREHKKEDVFVFNLYFRNNNVEWLYVSNHCKGHVNHPFLSWFRSTLYPRTGNMLIRKECMLEYPYREDLRRWEDIENTFNLMRNYRFYADQRPIFQYNMKYNEASKPRRFIEEDFTSQLDPWGKSWEEQLALRKLYYMETVKYYPQSVTEEYKKIFEGIRMRFLWKFVSIFGFKK